MPIKKSLCLYIEYLFDTNLIYRINELRGKSLGCYCTTKYCHAHILTNLLEKFYHYIEPLINKRQPPPSLKNILKKTGNKKGRQIEQIEHPQKKLTPITLQCKKATCEPIHPDFYEQQSTIGTTAVLSMTTFYAFFSVADTRITTGTKKSVRFPHPFSNWWHGHFDVEPVGADDALSGRWVCMEQFLMAVKADTFGDTNQLTAIKNLYERADRMPTYVAQKSKSLGRKVKNFNTTTWGSVDVDNKILRGLAAKVNSYKEISCMLRATGDKVIIEASPYDGIWGVKKSLKHLETHLPSSTDLDGWKDDPSVDYQESATRPNRLGRLLMRLRTQLSLYENK